MKDLNIPSTKTTPTVLFDATTGNLQLIGRSIPENPTEFYQVIYHWLDDYALNPASKTTLTVKVDYFMTSSSKCLLYIFKRLETISLFGHNVEIHWYHLEEDTDMHEAGEDYETLLKIPFRIIAAEEMK